MTELTSCSLENNLPTSSTLKVRSTTNVARRRGLLIKYILDVEKVKFAYEQTFIHRELVTILNIIKYYKLKELQNEHYNYKFGYDDC